MNMNIVMLAAVFLSTIVAAGGVTLAFSSPIDEVLARLIPGEIKGAWSRYAKFALLVTSFSSGLRLKELSSLPLASDASGAANAIVLNKCLIAVFQAVMGVLTGACEVLLVFFGATLLAYGAKHVYAALNNAYRQPRMEGHRPGVPAGRY